MADPQDLIDVVADQIENEVPVEYVSGQDSAKRFKPKDNRDLVELQREQDAIAARASSNGGVLKKIR